MLSRFRWGEGLSNASQQETRHLACYIYVGRSLCAFASQPFVLALISRPCAHTLLCPSNPAAGERAVRNADIAAPAYGLGVYAKVSKVTCTV